MTEEFKQAYRILFGEECLPEHFALIQYNHAVLNFLLSKYKLGAALTDLQNHMRQEE